MITTIAALLAAACFVPAAAKLLNRPEMQASAAHFGIPWPRYRLIGLAELAAAVGVLAGLARRPLGVAAASGMAVLLLGALVAHQSRRPTQADHARVRRARPEPRLSRPDAERLTGDSK